MHWLDRHLGGRRFVAAMVGGGGTFVLCLLGHISGTEYQWTTLGIIGAYITGGTAEKIKAQTAPP